MRRSGFTWSEPVPPPPLAGGAVTPAYGAAPPPPPLGGAALGAGGHPTAQGLGELIEIPHTEMYGERRHPRARHACLHRWFQGEVFPQRLLPSPWCRQGVLLSRPGHETFPIFYQPEIQKVLTNAVRPHLLPGQRSHLGTGPADEHVEPFLG